MRTALKGRLQRALRRRRTWAALLVLGLAGLFALYLLVKTVFGTQTDQPSLPELLAKINPQTIALVVAIYFVDLLVAILGWGLIIGRLSGFYDWLEHARIYTVTAIARHIPGSIWYVFGRILMYEVHAVPRSLVVVGTGIEFAAIVLGGIVVVGVTWPFTLHATGLAWQWIAAGAVVSVALLNPWTLRFVLRRLLPQTGEVPLRLRDIALWVGVYAVVWAIGGLMLYVLAAAFAPLPLSLAPALIGVWAVAGLVSTVFGFIPLGIGQDLTMTALLTLYIGPVESLFVALLMRFMVTLNTALWSLIAALFRLREVLDTIRAVSTAPAPSD